MPEKFFCCLSPRTGSHVVGVIQALGTAFAIAIALAQYFGYTNSPYAYGTAAVLAVGYVVPMLAYFTTLAGGSKGSKYFFAFSYFLFHLAVEAYCITVPIYYLAQYWN